MSNESFILLAKITQESTDSIYTSITDTQNETNVMINPRLICNKDEKKEKLMSLIEVAYNQLSNKNKLNDHHINHYEFYHNFFIFHREEEEFGTGELKKNSQKFSFKIYTILPNINFELKQIKNLSFSQTQLNKYLVKAEYKNEVFDPKKLLRSGFLTMSQEHRLICLKDDTIEERQNKFSQSLKHIIIGIWLNLKDENPSAKKLDLDTVLQKHMGLIYQKCFEYIQMTLNIDSVYSPSPDQGIFLLVVFYKTMQCHYEVTLIPNEEDKCITMKSVEDSHLFPHGYPPNWLIIKNKYLVNSKSSNKYDLSKEVLTGRVMSMSDYIAKKTEMNPKSFLTKSTGTRITTPSKLSTTNYFKDNLHEIFDNTDLEIDDMEDLYNLPLMMPVNFKLKKDIDTLNSGSCSSNRYGIQNDKQNEDISVINKSIDIFNKKDSTIAMLTKSNEEISHASTNNHSHKINSLGSSCIGSFNKTNNSNDFNPVQYTTIIKQQSETIKKLQNKVSLLEYNVKSVLNKLIRQDNNGNTYDSTTQQELCKSKESFKEEIKLAQMQLSLQKQYQQYQQNDKMNLKQQQNVNNISHQRLFEKNPNQKIKDYPNESHLHDISIKIPCIKYNKSILSEEEE